MQNNRPFITGGYQNDKPHGKFKMYYSNGKLQMSFQYNNGIRTGFWYTYNPKGVLIKKVLYKRGNEYLFEMRSHNGKRLLVKEGNGTFEDWLHLSIANAQRSKVVGKVKNGLPDGEWKFFTYNDYNYAKEYYENFKFIKGISISKRLGNQEYHDHYNASYTGMMFLERLKIVSPPMCSKYPINNLSFEDLKRRFSRSRLRKQGIKSWFFVEIKGGKNKKILDVKIISKAPPETIQQLKALIFKLKGTLSPKFGYNPGYFYFPMVIDGAKVFCPGDKEIRLLKFLY
jgi:hypothetical protein